MSADEPTLALLLPLLGGIVYVFAALLLKRAADLGAEVWRTARIVNYTSALVFAPLWLLGGHVPSSELWWQPALVALIFVAGQIFNLLALSTGDVSVATPVLSVKILLVALLTTLLVGEPLGAGLWIAALLSSAAIALLNYNPTHGRHRVARTILLASLAAASYALFDVLVQKWSPVWGTGRFLPLVMACSAAYSIAIRPFGSAGRAPRIERPDAGAGWVAAGAACFALQGLMLVSSIATYGHATVANVLYGARGLWSVLAVWGVGHWFANRERHHGARVLAFRIVGAILLMAALLIVLLGQAHASIV